MSDSLPPSAQGDASLDPTRLGPASPSPPPGHDLPPADRHDFEGYQIISELSRGGQGIVYEAIQRSTKRRVAIKLLLAGVQANDEARRRFQREIELLAQLRHPHIVSIFAADVTRDGRQYYVMDFVRGVPLDKYVASRQLGLHDVLVLFATICDAVQHAHGHGIIHRDLKPQNILVDLEGQPRVLDFGLARPLALTGDAALSLSQAVVGTVPYMAPEQAAGETSRVDARTDVYALGVTLYRVITNEFPYDVCGSLHQVLHNIRHAPPKRPYMNGRPVDAEAETILLKCLAKERSRRYQTAGELAADVRAYLAGQPIAARRDSARYILRKRADRWIHEHRLLAAMLLFLFSTVLGHMVFEPLANSVEISSRIDSMMVGLAETTHRQEEMRAVRILALKDETPLRTLATEQGLMKFDPANLQSLRALHGRAFKRLAAIRPQAVVSDILFRTGSDFDADLAAGIEALTREKIPVVLGVRRWWADEQGVPELSPALTPLARWGCAQLGGDNVPWQLPMILQRSHRDALPSLVLAGAAAFRHPRATATYVLDAGGSRAIIRYHQTDSENPEARRWLSEWDEIQLTTVQRVFAGSRLEKAEGVIPDDTVGINLFHLPREETLEAATLSYEAIFHEDPEKLRSALAGKLVLLADLRAGVDRHRYGEDRSAPGCHAHAVMIESILDEMSFSDARSKPVRSFAPIDIALCAAMGTLVGLRFSRIRRYVLLVLAALVLSAVCLTAAIQYRLLWNPIASILTCVVAAEICGATNTASLRHDHRPSA